MFFDVLYMVANGVFQEGPFNSPWRSSVVSEKNSEGVEMKATLNGGGASLRTSATLMKVNKGQKIQREQKERERKLV